MLDFARTCAGTCLHHLLQRDCPQLCRPNGELAQRSKIAAIGGVGPQIDVILLPAFSERGHLGSGHEHTEGARGVQNAHPEIGSARPIHRQTKLRPPADQRRPDVDDPGDLPQDLLTCLGRTGEHGQVRPADDVFDRLELSAAAELRRRPHLCVEAEGSVARQHLVADANDHAILTHRSLLHVSHARVDGEPVCGVLRVVACRDDCVGDTRQPPDVRGHLCSQALGGVEVPALGGPHHYLELRCVILGQEVLVHRHAERGDAEQGEHGQDNHDPPPAERSFQQPAVPRLHHAEDPPPARAFAARAGSAWAQPAGRHHRGEGKAHQE